MHRDHAVAYAQLPRSQIDQRNVAAMAVDDDELGDAGAVHALADLDEGAQRRLRRERERSAKRAMFARRADLLHRQKRNRRLLRQQRAHSRQIGLRDEGVGAEGKMGPVLFDSRNGEHRDARAGEFFRRE
jgi:hypothetical protein